MAWDGPVLALLSAARTSTGQSSAILPQSRGNFLHLGVDVTAVSGTTPTLDLTIEWSHDGGTTWLKGDPADAFTQLTAVAGRVKKFDMKGTLYRIVWTIAGTTPSFTFSATEYLTSG